MYVPRLTAAVRVLATVAVALFAIGCLIAGGAIWPNLTTTATAESLDNAPAWAAKIEAAQSAQAGAAAVQVAAAKAKATHAAVRTEGDTTIFELAMSQGVPAEIFSLSNPYRIIIDLPDLTFDLPESAGRVPVGLIETYRYGQFAEGKARIVIDTTGPARIKGASMAHATGGQGVILRVALLATDAASFGSGTGAGRPAPEEGPKDPTPAPLNPTTGAAQDKPIIVLDPGHGGIDPGAVGAGNVLEKDLVLSVSRRVRARLVASGRYQVVMTRDKDVFVSLDQRLKISQSNAAALFISLHADSIDQLDVASSIKGATIYTLSERASDAEARAMAEKENASDLLAGLDVAEGDDSGQVRSILIDLMKRETANFSTEFSRTLVGQMRSKVSLAPKPQRSAAFKVLKQTHAPSVLIELGFVSNAEEARQMQSAQWQERVAGAIVAAVDRYFSKRANNLP